MALTLDASTTYAGVASVTTLTQSHTVGTSGTMTALFLGLMIDGGSALPTGITATYNSVSMTSIGSVQDATNFLHLQWYYLAAPSTGANNLVLNWTNLGTVGFVLRSYYGVNQYQPYRTGSFTTMAATTGAPSVTVPCFGSDICLDIVLVADLLTVGAGQVSILNTAGYAASYEPASGSSSIVMSWTKAGTARNIAAGIAVADAYPSGSAAISPFLMF